MSTITGTAQLIALPNNMMYLVDSGTHADYRYIDSNVADSAPRTWGAIFRDRGATVQNTHSIAAHNNSSSGGNPTRGWAYQYLESTEEMQIGVCNGSGVYSTSKISTGTLNSTDWNAHSCSYDLTDVVHVFNGGAPVTTSTFTGYTGCTGASLEFPIVGTFAFHSTAVSFPFNKDLAGVVWSNATHTAEEMDAWQQSCKLNNDVMPFPNGTSIIYRSRDIYAFPEPLTTWSDVESEWYTLTLSVNNWDIETETSPTWAF